MQVEAHYVSDILRGDDTTEMRITLLKYIDDEMPPDDEQGILLLEVTGLDRSDKKDKKVYCHLQEVFLEWKASCDWCLTYLRSKNNLMAPC